MEPIPREIKENPNIGCEIERNICQTTMWKWCPKENIGFLVATSLE